MRFILALALGLRLAVVGIVLLSYPQQWLFSKAPDLGYLACSLSSGHGLSSPFGGATGPTAFLAPGYPGVMGLIFYFFGSYSLASARAHDAAADSVWGVDGRGHHAGGRAVVWHGDGKDCGNILGGIAAAALAAGGALGYQLVGSAPDRHGGSGAALRGTSGERTLGSHGRVLRSGDAGESFPHACLVGRAGVERVSNALSIVDLLAGVVRRVRSLASAECEGAARVYSPAQQFWI